VSDTPDNRNVIDHYKHWETEAIKADLNTKRLNFSVLCWNLSMDFNISSCIRACNSFTASRVYILGKKRYDKRGTVGTHHYENLKHVSMIEDIKDLPENSFWVGLDNVEGAENIETFEWPKDRHIVICLGMEQLGLSKEILEKCNKIVYIPMRGSVRSLNVAQAAAVALYSLTSKLYPTAV
jgi:tRNA G18 (ribose-2'-O)-methylase SpoU